MRWGIRPRSRNRLWRRYAKRSRPSTTPGRGAPWAMSFSITCSWMLPFFGMHPGSPAEPILAAWGITTAGKPVFVGLAPGVVESTDAWANFLTDLTDRGLACPLLVVSDGAAGLIAAIEQIFPTALRQRCLIHRLRNVLAKIPAGMQARDPRRLLGLLRHRRPHHRARPEAGRTHRRPAGRVRYSLRTHLPRSDEDRADRSRGPDRLSTVPARTSSPHPAL